MADFSREYLDYAKQMLGRRNELSVELLTIEQDIEAKKVEAGIDQLESKAKAIRKELKLLPDQVLCKADAETQGDLFARKEEDGEGEAED